MDSISAFVQQLKTDLEANRGRSVVVAGPRQPLEVHELVAAINEKLGNSGETIVFYRDPDGKIILWDGLQPLVERINKKSVETLLILGGNPVYTAPGDLSFAEAMKKVKNTIHLGLYHDETSQQCGWHLSQTHYLESWGDTRAYDGTVSIAQPLIAPLFDGKSPIEVLALILGRSSGDRRRRL